MQLLKTSIFFQIYQALIYFEVPVLIWIVKEAVRLHLEAVINFFHCFFSKQQTKFFFDYYLLFVFSPSPFLSPSLFLFFSISRCLSLSLSLGLNIQSLIERVQVVHSLL